MPRQRLTETGIQKRKPPAKGQVDIFDTVLPGFGVRVSYGGRRSFFVMVRIDGRLRRLTVGTHPALSLAEAREKARKVMEDAARGIDPAERRAEERRKAEKRRRDTFGAVAAEYMADRAADLRTAKEYRRQLDRDVLPRWADVPIKQIARSDVRTLLREKARTAPVAANRLQALISAIFNFGLDEDLIQSNPAARLRRQAKEIERERVLSQAELRAVWAACEAIGYPFGLLYEMALATAQRRGEVAAMRWSDIQDDAWMLPGELVKSGRGHHVPLSPLALQILDRVPRTGDLVFVSGRNGDNPLSGWSVAKKRLDGLCEVGGFRVHDFRRTAATGMRELGVDRLTVSKVLNHSESGITRVYDRYAEDREKRSALDAWARRLLAIVSEDHADNVVPLPR